MRMVVAAIGRMKSGAERDLVERYRDRARKAGRGVGVTRFDIRDIAEARAPSAERRRDDEAAALIADIPANAVVVALDESGKALSSRKFADWVGARRDDGTTDIHVLVGGPDGHGAAVKSRADLLLSLGAMTYPHQIARILIAEQIYRAITILSGHPYHRD